MKGSAIVGSINIHITGVGYDPAPVINILKSSLPCDKIHLLWNSDKRITESKDAIISALNGAGYHDDDVTAHEVNVYDYQAILNTAMLIAQSEKEKYSESNMKVCFYLNITHGTRLVTGALCTAAMLLGAQMYYLQERKDGTDNLSMDELIIRIPVPKIPDLDKLTSKRREFLKRVCSETDGVSISVLSMEFKSKQNVNQFVGYFEYNNLVERVREGQHVRIRATELGRMASNWLI